MAKRSRSIANVFVFLIYAYTEKIICTTLKITDQNVCPKTVSSNSGTQTKLILECCPDYFSQNGNCQACPAGIFGKNCSLPCMRNYHGVQCKKLCNCKDNKKCDPVHGCICDTGFTGSNCSNECPSGTYGVSCREECFCLHGAECDPVTGSCLCSAGWSGPHCTKECLPGKFGMNCSGICECSDGEKCDFITGNCSSLQDGETNLNSEHDSNKSKDTVMVYTMMAAALIGLVCVVTMVVKVKETLCRQVQKPKKETSKQKLKRRKAKRRRSSVQTQDAQTGSFIIDSEFPMFPLPMEEDVYCEIGDINTLEPDRY